MNFQNNRYTLRFANESDDEGIHEIFESGSFPGKMEVKFLRGARPYESFLADGDRAKIFIILDNRENRTAAVGGAVLRREYMNGREEECAYLTGLKVHPDYRGKLPFIVKGYGVMGKELAHCSICYTTVLDGNAEAVRMFEKRRKNIPFYRYMGHYTTYCFGGGKRRLPLEVNNMTGFETVMDQYFSHMNFVPVDYRYAGFGDTTFYCVRERGEITACCFVGDQRSTKQYKMCSYGGIYRVFSKFPTQFFGYPKFPKPDSVIDHGVISYLYVRENDHRLCRDFLYSVAAEAGFSLMIWGAFENHPLCGALDRMRTVHYGSRLYEVVWEESADVRGTIGIEAALL